MSQRTRKVIYNIDRYKNVMVARSHPFDGCDLVLWLIVVEMKRITRGGMCAAVNYMEINRVN